MSVGRADYRSWVLRILTWDTVLPACVAFVPVGVGLLFPGRREVMEFTAVILPIVAFFLRFGAGTRHIASNRCPKAIQRFQFCAFCLGILPLVLVDCALILSGLMPRGALFATALDRLVWAVLFSLYLASMIVAMYPGRVPHPPFDSDDLADLSVT